MERLDGAALVGPAARRRRRTYLPGDLLAKIDIATMAHSLEARSPLLDHELMEFAASLPRDLKAARAREARSPCARALRGWRSRRDPRWAQAGVRLPIADWLRGELARYARDVLLDPATLARGWFRPAYVRGLLDRHEQRLEDRSQAIWTLLALELWLRDVDGERRAAVSVLPRPAASSAPSAPKVA